MRVETLVSALNYDYKRFEKQNFKEDVLLINQGDDNFQSTKGNFRIVETTDRGIGSSRNRALQEAKGDIIIFADDDEVFEDNYTEIVRQSYKDNPDADLLFFNVRRSGDSRREGFSETDMTKLNYFNSLKYGAVNITARRKSIIDANINFDKRFGKNPWMFGEDSIFIYDALKAGLNIYYVDKVIAKVDLSESTWFRGMGAEFFYAKGAQFYRLSYKFNFLLMLQYLIRKRKQFKNEISMFKAMSQMRKGKKDFKKANNNIMDFQEEEK